MSSAEVIDAKREPRALAYRDLGMLMFETVTSITRLLVDMHLYVVSPAGRLFFGNNHEDNDTEHFRTNERVIIRKNEIAFGNYTIHAVSRFRMDDGEQIVEETFFFRCTF